MLAGPRQPDKKGLIFVRQIRPTLQWLLHLTRANANRLTRIVHLESRDRWGPTIVADASPWGGGALFWESWADYAANTRAKNYMEIQWNKEHEQLINGKTGVPDFQASWEALMYVIALKTWIGPRTRGKVTIIGDASGVLHDLIKMKARSRTVNALVQEAAMHLAPLGLDLAGIHVWAELNTAADELSRAAPGTEADCRASWAGARSTPTSTEPAAWPHCGPILI